MAVSCQIDWLTLTCLTSNEIHLIPFLERLLRTLCLDKIWDNGDFIYVGRDKFYSCIYRYNDISICLCSDTPEQLIRQGICFKFSSNGLSFYQEYLKKYYNKDLQYVCKRWRSLCCDGFFTRCSRFDFAIDDKCFSADEPLLTMRRVRNSLNRGEFTSRLTVRRSSKSSLLPLSDDTSSSSCSDVGDTVYLGRRKGGSILIRFYDKRLEQHHLKMPVDDVFSWVRCEFEFHNARSMAVFNAFCDNDLTDFNKYMSEVVHNYISFVYRDDVNISRCTVKRWWKKFLGTVKKSSLISPPYKPLTFVGTQRWLEKSVFPTLSRYVKCVGLDRFLKKLGEALHIPASPRVNQMVADYRTLEDFDYRKFLLSKDTYDNYFKLRCLDPWLLTGSVTSEELKSDFCSFNDFSPSALSFDGEQLILGDL